MMQNIYHNTVSVSVLWYSIQFHRSYLHDGHRWFQTAKIWHMPVKYWYRLSVSVLTRAQLPLLGEP